MSVECAGRFGKLFLSSVWLFYTLHLQLTLLDIVNQSERSSASVTDSSTACDQVITLFGLPPALFDIVKHAWVKGWLREERTRTNFSFVWHCQTQLHLNSLNACEQLLFLILWHIYSSVWHRQTRAWRIECERSEREERTRTIFLCLTLSNTTICFHRTRSSTFFFLLSDLSLIHISEPTRPY